MRLRYLVLPWLAVGIANAQVQTHDIRPTAVPIPADAMIGEVAGVAALGSHLLYVGLRTDASHGPSRLLEYSVTNGIPRFNRELAPALMRVTVLHAVRVDRNGNPWIVDNVNNTVVKLDPEGTVLMVLGRRVASPVGAQQGLFSEPADVAFDGSDGIYVADRSNNRVVKLTPTGDWAGTFANTGPANRRVLEPHAVVVVDQRVYVADAGNRRLQVYGTDGSWKQSLDLQLPAPTDPITPDLTGTGEPTIARGSPTALCAAANGSRKLFVADASPGSIRGISLDSLKIVETAGSPGHAPGQLGWVHAMSCPSDFEIWVAELLNWRAQRLHLVP